MPQAEFAAMTIDDRRAQQVPMSMTILPNIARSCLIRQDLLAKKTVPIIQLGIKGTAYFLANVSLSEYCSVMEELRASSRSRCPS